MADCRFVGTVSDFAARLTHLAKFRDLAFVDFCSVRSWQPRGDVCLRRGFHCSFAATARAFAFVRARNRSGADWRIVAVRPAAGIIFERCRWCRVISLRDRRHRISRGTPRNLARDT